MPSILNAPVAAKCASSRRRGAARLGKLLRLAGNGRMIQIAAQIRILAAVGRLMEERGSTPSPSFAGKS